MLKLSGTMTSPTSGKVYVVVEMFNDSALANDYICSLKKVGYTAQLECTVYTGAGPVTYTVTV